MTRSIAIKALAAATLGLAIALPGRLCRRRHEKGHDVEGHHV